MSTLAQQQALAAMFRESFAPLVQLGQNRVAFEAQRAQLQEAGLQQQLARAAEGRRMAQQEEMVRLQAQLGLEGAKAAAELNRTAAKEANSARSVAEARRLAASLGLEVDESKFDSADAYVRQVNTEAGKKTRERRGTATGVWRQIQTLDQQIEGLGDGELSPAEEIQIARRAALGFALDDKAKKAITEAKTLDELYTVAGNAKGIEEVLGNAKALRIGTLQRKQAPLVRKRQELSRNLDVLAREGILPEIEDTPKASAGGDSAAGIGADTLTGDDLAALFGGGKPAAKPASAAPESRTGGGLGSGAVVGGLGATAALTSPAVRSALGISRAAALAGTGARLGARYFIPGTQVFGAGLAGYELGQFLNEVPTRFGRRSVSDTAADALSGTYSDWVREPLPVANLSERMLAADPALAARAMTERAAQERAALAASLMIRGF
jgi:hypothetical protein